MEEEIESMIGDLWAEFADESDGWQTTMNYVSFKKAVNKIFEIHSWNKDVDSAPKNEHLLFLIEYKDNSYEVKYGVKGLYTENDFECLSEMGSDGEYAIYKKENISGWMPIPKYNLLNIKK